MPICFKFLPHIKTHFIGKKPCFNDFNHFEKNVFPRDNGTNLGVLSSTTQKYVLVSNIYIFMIISTTYKDTLVSNIYVSRTINTTHNNALFSNIYVSKNKRTNKDDYSTQYPPTVFSSHYL